MQLWKHLLNKSTAALQDQLCTLRKALCSGHGCRGCSQAGVGGGRSACRQSLQGSRACVGHLAQAVCMELLRSEPLDLEGFSKAGREL